MGPTEPNSYRRRRRSSLGRQRVHVGNRSSSCWLPTRQHDRDRRASDVVTHKQDVQPQRHGD